ncbi:hypothetical protein RMSM_02000 [Rhodopirellula maiorica SM1]|uniref:Uncharacterized protein n=1 Tax=Rhodopirellula maiorica SM1 TaxID=1265738 RepID=M5RP25_9BACT|nr:hypothetical protein RMSM_02000 [Rhodopirellula maiorica SM1]
MSSAKQTDHDFVDDRFLADDDFAQLFNDSLASFMQSFRVSFADPVLICRGVCGHATSLLLEGVVNHGVI